MLSPLDRPSDERGFTLVEMVIAVSLAAVVFLGLAGVLNAGVRAYAVAKTRAQANEIATAGIEDLQRFAFNDLGLCGAPSGTAPSGLDETVLLASCASAPTAPPSTTPCVDVVFGSIPLHEYNCLSNNVAYTVRRYVAWADPLKTTKRLAVFVDWTDMNGTHQVSQQSSLRAPDQSAITGLAPPKFAALPTATALPSPIQIDTATRQITLGQVNLNATTDNLFTAASTTLTAAIPTHAPGDRLDISLTSASGFPNYNGYPVTIGAETFRVIAGAGTISWSVIAEGSTSHPSGTAVSFAGDQVYVTFQTLDAGSNPQTSTVFLSSSNGTDWSSVVDSSDGFLFGEGSQFFSFGILRRADGKTAAAFASPAVQFCPSGGCTGALPGISTIIAPSTVDINPGGDLVSDVTVRVTTTNITSADSVTVSFVTQAGATTVLLEPDPAAAACPDPASATAGVSCSWVGTIAKASGHKFNGGAQKLFFSARQVVLAGTIDQGSTAAQASSEVAFS